MTASHHRDETCASHMPVLMEFVRAFKPRRVLELGCGYYSTKLFLDECEHVVSVESDSDEWLHVMRAHFGSRSGWEHIRLSGLEAICGYMNQRGERFDLIFVDGDVYRAEETNHAFGFAPTVIGHDTQGWHVGDGRPIQSHYAVPPEFGKIDFANFPIRYGNQVDEFGVGPAGLSDRPWTTLFTRDRVVYEHFSGVEMELYGRYLFPYVYKECPNDAGGRAAEAPDGPR